MISSSNMEIMNEIFEVGTRVIELIQGYYVIVDESDFERVSKYKWCVHIHRRKNGLINGPYAQSKINGKWILLHRFILGLQDPNMKVDHINHDGLNNCRNNLRLCTNQQNQGNRRKQPNTSSKFKGVSWYKRDKKWRSSIKVDGKHINLGRFDIERDAAVAYNLRAYIEFGEFAKLNNLQEE